MASYYDGMEEWKIPEDRRMRRLLEKSGLLQRPERRIDFVYSPLSGPDEFRLLKLSPGRTKDENDFELKTYRFDEAPPYDTVSYTWGNPEPRGIAFCNNKCISISPNLQWGLQRIRSRRSQLMLWIDAVCIDQTNDKEKSEQVQLMGKIYNRAVKVHVWLGPDTKNDASKAIAIIKRAEQLAREESGRGPKRPVESSDVRWERLSDEEEGRSRLHASTSDWRSLRHLILSPWFTRLWIVQEVAVARSRIAYYGDQSIDVDIILTGILWLQKKYYARQLGLDTPYLHRPVTIWSIIRRQAINTPRFLHEYMPDLRYFDCEDPRDRIFSVVGISAEGARINTYEQPPAFKPDYSKTLIDVLCGTARHIIQSKADDDVYYQERLQDLWWHCDDLLPDWPSWVPRLHAGDCNDTVRSASAAATARTSRDTKVQTSEVSTSQILKIRGILVDEVTMMDEFVRLGHQAWKTARMLYLEYRRIHGTGSSFTAMLKDGGVLTQFALGITGINSYWTTRSANVLEDFLDWWNYYEDYPTAETTSHDKPETHQQIYIEMISTPEARSVGEGEARDFDSRIPKQAKTIITSQGLIGSAPSNTELGDVVCVIYGCNLPVMLRPIEGHYRLLGLCNVPILRKGAALDLEEEGKVQDMWFEIH